MVDYCLWLLDWGWWNIGSWEWRYLTVENKQQHYGLEASTTTASQLNVVLYGLSLLPTNDGADVELLWERRQRATIIGQTTPVKSYTSWCALKSLDSCSLRRQHGDSRSQIRKRDGRSRTGERSSADLGVRHSDVFGLLLLLTFQKFVPSLCAFYSFNQGMSSPRWLKRDCPWYFSLLRCTITTFQESEFCSGWSTGV